MEPSGENSKYRWLLQDFGKLLKQEIGIATQLREQSYGRRQQYYPYISGYLIGLYLAARLLMEEAQAFGISAKDVGLEGLELEPAMLFKPWEHEDG